MEEIKMRFELFKDGGLNQRGEITSEGIDLKLEDGEYSLQANGDGYETEWKNFTMAGQTEEITMEFKRKLDEGEVTFPEETEKEEEGVRYGVLKLRFKIY